MQNLPTTTSSAASPPVSLSKVGTHQLQAWLAENVTPDQLLDRTKKSLALFFDPNTEAEDKAMQIEGFIKALSDFPFWAVNKAFDQWEREKQHRPSPASIRIVALREVERVAKEIKRRRPPPEPDPERVVSPEMKARIAKVMEPFSGQLWLAFGHASIPSIRFFSEGSAAMRASTALTP